MEKKMKISWTLIVTGNPIGYFQLFPSTHFVVISQEALFPGRFLFNYSFCALA